MQGGSSGASVPSPGDAPAPNPNAAPAPVPASAPTAASAADLITVLTDSLRRAATETPSNTANREL